MLSELRVGHDARRKCGEPQTESKTIRFLLTVACDEYLRPFGSGVPARDRRACESGAARDQNDRSTCRHRPQQRRLAEVKCDLDVSLPVDGEFLPALLVQR